MLAAMAIAACLTAASPCGPSGAPAAPVPLDRFTATYERSGGLLPEPRKVVIRHRKALLKKSERVVAGVGTSSTTVKLSDRKLKQFRAAISQPRFAAYESPFPGNCADCFIYTVAYRGEKVSVEEVDVPTRMRPLIDRAEALIAAHLPFH